MAPGDKIGILGGGQLARMMALQGHAMGLSVYVLSPSPDDPAAQVTKNWVQGKPDDERDLKAFFEQVKTVTFESEFLPADLIQRLANLHQVKVFPDPELMGLLQDRLTQKEWLAKYQLPTADFMAVNDVHSLMEARQRFKTGIVLKKRRFGYDGCGTFVIPEKSQLTEPYSFNLNEPTGFIAERLVRFKREMALIAARNTKNDIVFFPLVETHQVNSRCQWVMGPMKHRALSRLKTKIKKALKQSHYVGVIAFELFDIGSQLMVNEIAPRVHNSGHFSLDAFCDDQFTLHLKAILGQKLMDPPVVSGFAMYNLLGQSQSQPQWKLPAGVHLHWYGKTENRPGRKMGHLNTTAQSPKRALSLLLKAAKGFQL